MKRHLDVALEVAADSVELLLDRAMAKFFLGEYEAVLMDTGSALKVQANHIPALLLRGRTYYMLNDFELAQRHFREGLRMDPEHKECKQVYRQLKAMLNTQKNADEELAGRKLQEAYEDYTKGMQFDPQHRHFNSKMMLGRCKCRLKMKKHKTTIEECTAFIDMLQEGEHDRGQLVEGVMSRAEAHLASEDYDNAVRDFEYAHKLQPDNGHVNEALNNAKKRQKMAKRKDYYKILGVSSDADERTIRKAYKRAALKWHPDKAKPEEREENEKKFRDVAEAHEVLLDPEKRARFDNGEDINEPPPQQQNPFGGGGFTFHFGGGGFKF